MESSFRGSLQHPEATTGAGEQIARLGEAAVVRKIGEKPRYYRIEILAVTRFVDGQEISEGAIGWSYKGNFEVLDDEPSGPTPSEALTKEDLLGRADVLKIIVIDVEMGDATLIVCPEEDGEQDVLLIDTGVNDADRIRAELISNGFTVSGKPITRFYVTHYDLDHIGDAEALIPLSEIVYDHGNNNIDSDYLIDVSRPGVDRRLMTLSYEETFTGGVTMECVAVNQKTDCDAADEEIAASASGDNPNSIALIMRYDDFDYFTGGDLTFPPEKSLAECIANCDVYHVNHHGSETTSSAVEFVQALDPEVSVVSNGTAYGHPRRVVAERLLQEVDGPAIFVQTNL